MLNMQCNLRYRSQKLFLRSINGKESKMRITRDEFDQFKHRINNLDYIPEYIPTEKDIASIENRLDQYLPYLYWVYVKYPRSRNEEELLDKVRPLLKNIHVYNSSRGNHQPAMGK